MRTGGAMRCVGRERQTAHGLPGEAAATAARPYRCIDVVFRGRLKGGHGIGREDERGGHGVARFEHQKATIEWMAGNCGGDRGVDVTLGYRLDRDGRWQYGALNGSDANRS